VGKNSQILLEQRRRQGKLVTDGIYAYIRHPQYAGFMLVTLGLLVHWATIPLLIMWPILMVIYYRLAKREERGMEKEFGNQYLEYKRKTSMFFPLRWQSYNQYRKYLRLKYSNLGSD